MTKFKIILLVIIASVLFVSAALRDNLNIAKALIKKGKFQQGIDYLKKAENEKGETEDICLLFGKSYFQIRKYFWAEKYLSKCIDINSKNEDAFLLLFRIQDKLKKYEEAITTLNQLAGISKNKGEILYKMGEVFQKLMEKEKSRAAEYKKEAIKNYKLALDKDKQLYQAAVKIAEIYFIDREYLEALKYFEIALKINPKHPIALEGRNIAGYSGNFNAAEAYFKKKQYAEAVLFYLNAQKYSPKNYQVLVKLANCYYLVREYKQALTFLQRSLKIKKKPTEAYYLLGLVYYNIENYNKAEEYLKNCIRQAPKDPKAYYYMGKIKAKQKLNKDAIRFYKSAIKRKNKPEYRKSLGLLYLTEHEYEKSINELEIAEDLDSKLDLSKYLKMANTLNYVKKGHAAFEKNEFDDALDHYEDAVDITPMVQIYLSIGNTLIKLKEYEDAVKNLLKAKNMDPNIIEVYESLALAYRKLNKFQTADKLYEDLKKKMQGKPEISYKSDVS